MPNIDSYAYIDAEVEDVTNYEHGIRYDENYDSILTDEHAPTPCRH
jgi:hypothetical protein